jgi:probable F420-dependent oxidoreductase
MRLDVRLDGAAPDAGALARRAEALGFDGAWTSETGHDPFLPLALAAEHTRTLALGTSIAVAFPRNPLVTAHLAWDLQRLSGGRFILGLGTQVKGHLQRRFGLPWDAPGPRLRDYVGALRAIWGAWQQESPLEYRGEFYTHTFMPPFFRPAPIAHPAIPVTIAGVQEHMCSLAGEIADGLHVHPLHSAAYLKTVVLPAIARGAGLGGRAPSACPLIASVLIATGATRAETDAAVAAVRRQIAFYASTPNYRIVLACHGWEGIGADLTRRSVRGDWDGMAALVTDEMLEAFSVTGAPDAVARILRARYAGLAERLAVYAPFRPDESLSAQQALLDAFRT